MWHRVHMSVIKVCWSRLHRISIHHWEVCLNIYFLSHDRQTYICPHIIAHVTHAQIYANQRHIHDLTKFLLETYLHVCNIHRPLYLHVMSGVMRLQLRHNIYHLCFPQYLSILFSRFFFIFIFHILFSVFSLLSSFISFSFSLTIFYTFSVHFDFLKFHGGIKQEGVWSTPL